MEKGVQYIKKGTFTYSTELKKILRNGLNHVDTKFNATMCVIKTWFGNSTNAIITISKEFDS